MSVLTDSSNGVYVCPVIADMTAGITASAGAVALAQEHVNITGISAEFYVQLNETQSTNLLNAFTISGGMSDYADVRDYIKGSTDVSNNTTAVALTDVDAFKGVLRDAIAAALSNSSYDGGTGINAYLNGQFSGKLHALILSTLGVDLQIQSSVAIDASGGAASTSDDLTHATFGAARCETMFLQIHQSDLSGNYQEANGLPKTSALPLSQGDVLVFVFDVTAPGNVTVASQNVVDMVLQSAGSLTDPAQAAGVETGVSVTANTSKPYAWDNVSVNYAGQTRRIAVNVKMSGTTGGFALKAWA
jgi:hypothetical protein